MEPSEKDPILDWVERHPELEGSEQDRKVMQLGRACSANITAVNICHMWEAWIADRSQPKPDMVQCVAYYGKSRLITRHWKEFPIEVPKGQEDVWRAHRIGASLEEFRDVEQAGVAGGFLQVAGIDPELMAATLIEQLAERVRTLEEVLQNPEQTYTVADLDDFEWDEEEGDEELNRLNKPFSIFEVLFYFRFAFPKLRGYAVTEDSDEVGLPNIPLYEALMEVDVNTLIGDMYRLEPLLKRARKRIAEQPEHDWIDYAGRFTAPEEFWWRRWYKTHKDNRPKRDS